jgi:hypothetical protein
MNSNLTFLSVVARHIPALYDVLFPHGPAQGIGPVRGAEVALNPQPLPPAEAGIRFASSLVELDGFADKLGQEVKPIADWDDPIDTLGAPNAAVAALIAWLVRHGYPVPPDPEPDWYREASVGVLLGLARAGEAVERSQFLGDVFEQASVLG